VADKRMFHRKPYKSLTLFSEHHHQKSNSTQLFRKCKFPFLFSSPLCVFLTRYVTVGRSFFSLDLGKKGELGNGIEYWRGYYQSLRPTQMGLSLNIGIASFTCIHFDYLKLMH
jgi:hypothetical protein